MGLIDRIRQLKLGSQELPKDYQEANSIPGIELHNTGLNQLKQVTEKSLKVWRTLPEEIRHDPSMVSFQMENDRVHDSIAFTESESMIEDAKSIGSSGYTNLSKENSVIVDTSVKEECLIRLKHGDDTINYKQAKELCNYESKKQQQRVIIWKRVGLISFWIFATAALINYGEKHLLEKTIEVPQGSGKFFRLVDKPTGDFQLKIIGHFNETSVETANMINWLIIQPQILYFDNENGSYIVKNILQPWKLSIVPLDLIEHGKTVIQNLTYKISSQLLSVFKHNDTKVRLRMTTNLATDIAVVLSYNPRVVNVQIGSIMAALILLVFYTLLVYEIFERPFTAMICCILSVAVLAVFNNRPNMDELIQWMNMEVLTLLFCMMIIVFVLKETGIFDYLAVLCFQISGGKVWPMTYSLSFVTCLISSVLDNMTTVLLMTPITIRLCEVMGLDPVPIIIAVIVHANIGGALTPIGDPVSIIIGTNRVIAEDDVNFTTFVEHTLSGVVLIATWNCIYLRIIFRNIHNLRLNETNKMKELRREIKIWQRALNAISTLSKDTVLVRSILNNRVKILKHSLHQQRLNFGSLNTYESSLEDLRKRYPIKNKTLLLKSAGVLSFVIICFFIQSIPRMRTLPLGWIALLGVILLLIILDRNDMEHLLHRVEWTTLLFFAAMFVMMECVERLGLFIWISELTESIILFVDKKNRLAMAIFIILWISALASTFLGSVPVTAIMVKLVVSLKQKESLELPVQPLVWALTFGSSLGGNGTLNGASSNVIAVHSAEQHGYKISFIRYLKTVFPMMAGQLVIITIYLLIAHIWFEWH